MSLNAYEIRKILDESRYAAYARDAAPPPGYEVLKLCPELRTIFRSSSETDTNRLGEAASEFFISVSKDSFAENKRYRLGLAGEAGAGKTPFSESFLSHIDTEIGLQPLTRTEITTSFNVAGIGKITHHDAGHRMKDSLAVAWLDQSGLDMVEYPHLTDHPVLDMYWHFDIDRTSRDRFVTLLVNDELAQKAAFDNFLSAARAFKIDLT